MNRLIIIGAGGHGKVIADNALKNGYTDIYFIDDNATGKVMGFPIIGTSNEIKCLNDGSTDFIVGIGNNVVRKKISETYDVHWATLIHPSAQIATGVCIGKGTVVMANAVVNACATIGEHCIINTSAIVEHDNVIGDYVHLSPRVALGGTVHIGDLTHIGIGVTVNNNIDVCGGCIVGSGAVVIKTINICGTYVGVPAKELL